MQHQLLDCICGTEPFERRIAFQASTDWTTGSAVSFNEVIIPPSGTVMRLSSGSYKMGHVI